MRSDLPIISESKKHNEINASLIVNGNFDFKKNIYKFEKFVLFENLFSFSIKWPFRKN